MAKALLKNASYLHLRVHNGWGVYQNHPQGHLPTILPVVVERWMALELGQGNVDIAQAFRSDHQLQRYVLTDVTSTGRKLGTGSYGAVEEVSLSSS